MQWRTSGPRRKGLPPPDQLRPYGYRGEWNGGCGPLLGVEVSTIRNTRLGPSIEDGMYLGSFSSFLFLPRVAVVLGALEYLTR